MSNIKVICDRDDLVAIADGFRTSRGITNELNLGEMAELAAEKVSDSPKLDIMIEETEFEGEEYELSFKSGSLFEGQTITIIFDGVTYVCESWIGKFGIICYGNGDYDAGNIGNGDSSVPFFFDESGFIATSSGTHTVTVGVAIEGGSGEIPTCTVRFIGGENCYYRGIHHYTKCVDGVISLVSNNSTQSNQYFDYTFDNVVCGSIIYFSWSYADADSGRADIVGNSIQLNDGNTTSESYLFRAPMTSGELCTIELIGDNGDLGGI